MSQDSDNKVLSKKQRLRAKNIIHSGDVSLGGE